MKIVEVRPTVKKEVKELSLLFQVSQLLDSSPDLRDVVGPVLKVLREHAGIVQGLQHGSPQAHKLFHPRAVEEGIFLDISFAVDPVIPGFAAHIHHLGFLVVVSGITGREPFFKQALGWHDPDIFFFQ